MTHFHSGLRCLSCFHINFSDFYLFLCGIVFSDVHTIRPLSFTLCEEFCEFYMLLCWKDGKTIIFTSRKNVEDFTGPRERSDLGFITFDITADILFRKYFIDFSLV